MLVSEVSLGAMSAVFVARFLYVYWDNPQLVNYAVACIPVILTILIAFVPDLRRAPVRWRIAIVAIGLIWSGLLWRQLVQAEREQAKVAREQIRVVAEAVSTAVAQSVEKSNKHSDTHSEQQTEAVKKELHVEMRQFAGTVTGEFAKDTATIAEKAKPAPPGIAKLAFTFAPFASVDALITTIHAHVVDGAVTVSLAVGNISDYAAVNPEIWVRLCDSCTYAKEPEGLEKLKGQMEEHDRYKRMPTMNPEVFTPAMSVSIAVPIGAPDLQIGVRYACETCGHVRNFHMLTVIIDQ
jgi:hypothetical protein